jgi:predicted RNase H-like HicB family nuclease
MTEWKENKDEQFITLKVTKGATGVYVGQVQEVPAIIVQAETKEKLIDEAMTSLNVYAEEFPEKYQKIFSVEPTVEYKKVPIRLPPAR